MLWPVQNTVPIVRALLWLTLGKHWGLLKVICPGKRFIFTFTTSLQHKGIPKRDMMDMNGLIIKYDFIFVVFLIVNIKDYLGSIEEL